MIDYVIARGGTSRGVFLRADDIDGMGDIDSVLIQLFGVGSPRHIDGIGAGSSSSSKAMIIDAVGDRLSYRFGQVGPQRHEVRWEGHCGNLSVALPIAAATLFPELARTSLTTINESTGQVVNFERMSTSDPLDLRPQRFMVQYADVGPAVLDAVLPTGRTTGEVEDPDLGRVVYTVVDITNPCVFASAVEAEPGSVRALDDDVVLRVLQRIRRLAAVECGLAQAEAQADDVSPILPRATLLERLPGADALPSNLEDPAFSSVFSTRTLSAGLLHASVPLTTALALVGATALPGTIVHTDAVAGSGDVQVQHPLGEISIRPEFDAAGTITGMGFTRDARLITLGRIPVPDVAATGD